MHDSTYVCTLLSVKEGAWCARCVQQCVQKTKAKPLPPPKLRGKIGIVSGKEPEDIKSPQRAKDRRQKKKKVNRHTKEISVPITNRLEQGEWYNHGSSEDFIKKKMWYR